MAKKTQKQSDKKRPLHIVKKSASKAKQRFGEHRQASPHRSFRMTRRSEIPKYQKIPAWWRLAARSFKLLKSEWKKILLLLVIFAPLSWLVSGIYNQDFSDLKLTLSLFGEGNINAAEQALVLFTGFFTAQTSNIPQDSLIILNILGLLLWLSVVWIARYNFAHKQTTLREAIYTSGAAIVPFVLLLLLLIVQLIPATIAGLIFSNFGSGGFTQSTIEIALFTVLALLLIVFSLYFITSTLVALQVVALPGMYPWRALRNARKLVSGRRFAVLRKLIMAPIIILFGWIVIFVPILMLDNAICPAEEGGACWSTLSLVPLAYFILVGLSVAFMSVYLYVMYRALLEQEDSYV